jgi:hypothetical protein
MFGLSFVSILILHKAFENSLHARFKPQDAISTYEFSKALWSIKMETKESPEVLFSRIASLKNYYGVLDYDEQQLIAVVSNAVKKGATRRHSHMSNLRHALCHTGGEYTAILSTGIRRELRRSLSRLLQQNQT